MAEIKSITDLLSMDLKIPSYQRPYKWKIQNIEDLLSDISKAISDADKYRTEFKYRIGTIIVHENSLGVYEIVDGQQRVISLTLIKQCIDPEFHCSILDEEFDNKTAQINIRNNYTYIREWFTINSALKDSFNKAFDDILEVVVISVDKISEAFQLFDSQNTRGKELDPHDLLKAYHLREMKRYPYEMEHAVTKWESKSTDAIRELFDFYLFPITNWARGIKSKSFTAKEIDAYKGVEEGSDYSYARRASRGMPYFQITEPFVAGNDFFEMVDHYLKLLADIEKELEDNDAFKQINGIITNKSDLESSGFKYTVNLFKCALLMYYDKFHNFDEMAVKKLFTWAFMVRVDLYNLSYDSINKYAIGGDPTSNYTNKIPIFSKISFARKHNEICGLQIKVKRNSDSAANPKWDHLFDQLKSMNGIKEDTV